MRTREANPDHAVPHVNAISYLNTISYANTVPGVSSADPVSDTDDAAPYAPVLHLAARRGQGAGHF